MKSSGGKGNWSRQKNVPNQWRMSYNSLTFSIRLSPFKHTGVFPEQSVTLAMILGESYLARPSKINF